MIEEIVGHLKSEGLVFVSFGKENALLGDIGSKLALEKLHDICKFDFTDQCVLIGEIGCLYDYVQKIPEIAWDIVDFSERPLEVIYSKGKNLPDVFLDEAGSVKLRLEKEGELHNILRKFPKGLFFVQSTEEILEHQVVKGKYNLKSHYDLEKRIIKLELDGQIKFIKK